MEQVLCIRRADIPAKWLNDKSTIKMEEDLFFKPFLLPDFTYHWVDRHLAERDSSFKQIIPYIVIQADNANLTAIYRRDGGESRLHGLWSIGIGGHINPLDNCTDSQLNSQISLREIVYAGMIREFNEEIIAKPQYKLAPQFIGTINEELTDVGKVHFGLVFKILADSPDCFTAGEELVDFKWVKTDSLLSDRCTKFNLELWSEMAIKFFK